MPEQSSDDIHQFESNAINIGTIFGTNQKLYKIPILQRRYVWEEEDVNSLFDDISQSAQDFSSNYFVGAMVFAKDKDKKRLLVIDGQQRLITFVLLIAAARNYYKLKNDDKKDVHQSKLCTTKGRISSSGEVTYVPEFFLESNDKDKKFFELILKNEDGTELKPQNPIEKNMLDARILADRFVNSIAEKGKLDIYMEYVYNNVYTAFTEANNKKSAFKVFMTLNSRGVALEPEDLIKALLLSRVDESEVEEIESEWNKIIDNLTRKHKYVVAIPTFLKHYLMSIGEYKSKDDIYDWFEAKYKDSNEDDVRACIKELQEASAYYGKLSENQSGSASLDTINTMKFRQSYIVLMACNRISDDIKRTNKEIIDGFMDNLARLAIEQAILKLRTNEFENLFTDISKRIGDSRDSLDDLKKILEEINKEVEKKRDLALSALQNYISETKSDEKKILHILKTLAKALDGNDYSAYTLEHIAPQERVSDWSFIPEDTYDDNIRSFGNLTILTDSENTSAGVKPFSEKRKIFENCSCRLTKSLSCDIRVTGTTDTRFDKAIEALSYDPLLDNVNWDYDNIKERAMKVKNLADYVLFKK